MSNQAEREQINHVYRQWHGVTGLNRYAWHRPEVQRQEAERMRALADLLPATVGADLSGVRAIDVGCGHGRFLRQLIDWGATPSCLAGTELQRDRLDAARQNTAPGVRWHLGSLDAFPSDGADLVSAHAVFSSILDEDMRRELAAEMWRVLRPDGWALIFDVRYGSTNNTQVRKVTDVELLRFWPTEMRHYRTLVLTPPVGRVMSRLPRLLPEALVSLVPLLRSHFIYMAQK